MIFHLLLAKALCFTRSRHNTVSAMFVPSALSLTTANTVEENPVYGKAISVYHERSEPLAWLQIPSRVLMKCDRLC